MNKLLGKIAKSNSGSNVDSTVKTQQGEKRPYESLLDVSIDDDDVDNLSNYSNDEE